METSKLHLNCFKVWRNRMSKQTEVVKNPITRPFSATKGHLLGPNFPLTLQPSSVWFPAASTPLDSLLPGCSTKLRYQLTLLGFLFDFLVYSTWNVSLDHHTPSIALNYFCLSSLIPLFNTCTPTHTRA